MESHNRRLVRPAYLQQTLRLTAQTRFGYHSCPCCGERYTVDPYVEGAPRDPRRRTRGHNVPHSRGGKLWVYQCYRCNTDQQRATFREWSRELELAADPRAPNVVWLADLFDSLQGTSL